MQVKSREKMMTFVFVATLLLSMCCMQPFCHVEALSMHKDTGEIINPLVSALATKTETHTRNSEKARSSRNSYDLFGSHKAPNARICDPAVETCDPLSGAVSKEALEKLRALDKDQWPRRRPLEVAALGYNAAVLGASTSELPPSERRAAAEATDTDKKKWPHRSSTPRRGVKWSWRQKQWRVDFADRNERPPLMENLGFFDDDDNAARVYDRRVIAHRNDLLQRHQEQQQQQQQQQRSSGGTEAKVRKSSQNLARRAEKLLLSLNFDAPDGFKHPPCRVAGDAQCGELNASQVLALDQPGVHYLGQGRWGAAMRAEEDGMYIRLGETRFVEETATAKGARVYFPFFRRQEDAEVKYRSSLLRAEAGGGVDNNADNGSNNLFAAMDGAHAVGTGRNVLLARKGLDGRISRQEWDAFWTHFAKVAPADDLWDKEDRNGDGFLSWEEFSGPKGDRPSSVDEPPPPETSANDAKNGGEARHANVPGASSGKGLREL